MESKKLRRSLILKRFLYNLCNVEFAKNHLNKKLLIDYIKSLEIVIFLHEIKNIL